MVQEQSSLCPRTPIEGLLTKLREDENIAGCKEVVSIVKVDNLAGIYEKIRDGFRLIGNPKFQSTDIVAIKPNLCCIKGPETGATTDPRVVEGIVRYLQEEFQVSDISIVESDGTQVLADMAFKLLGYESLSKRLNVKLVNLSKVSSSYKVFDGNVFLKKIKYPHILEKANWLISVPKIKSHTLCSFGGTMKNQYGCNPYPNKSIYHKNLHDYIVDLNRAFKPQLIVVDGIVAMEGRGPVDGIPIKMNALIFGRDVVAVDHLIARIIGINPNRVRYFVEARKRGLGTTNYKIVGTSLKDIEQRFKSTPRRRNLYGLFSQ
jgi:uncharacterized protein (DUF362 family)